MPASPDLFRVLGIPLVSGRGFDTRDAADTPRVVVLSRQTAQHLFGSTEAVGRTVLMETAAAARLGDRGANSSLEAWTVIGVARDTAVGTLGLSTGRNLIAYVPFAQREPRVVTIVARSSRDPDDLAAVLRAGIRAADPDLVVVAAGSGADMLDGFGRTTRLLAGAAGALGGIVLVLTMSGLFGVLSQLVARRTRELGIRAALGASPRDLRRLVLGDGMRPVGVGVVAGLTIGTLAGMFVHAMMGFAFGALDPIAVALAPVPLVLATVAACHLPARRAARVDPNVALREL
ncbi:MAG TPA: FtsX-like permease family protein [Dongiaceae bacterium]|nr:FtsX-like permease family protein [Dongiaceae bacterium]